MHVSQTSLSFHILLSTSAFCFSAEWLDAPLRCPPEGNVSLLFFTQCCSQLCWAQSWAAELNAQCPSAGHRIFAPGSSHRDLHNPGHSSQGLSWQVLCEIEKRYYQCHGGPAQSLNKSNTSSSFLTAQSLHHSPLSR